jgi:transcription initiation factor TFIIIB Brf1 subunit/transcription initiation factor TFIIB
MIGCRLYDNIFVGEASAGRVLANPNRPTDLLAARQSSVWVRLCNTMALRSCVKPRMLAETCKTTLVATIIIARMFHRSISNSVRIPMHPDRHSNNIRTVIPEYPDKLTRRR